MDVDYAAIFQRVISDARYLRNLDWGEPRSGHPEGSIRAHIAEIEPNLERLKSRLSESDYWKLKLLIHIHDTFKGEAKSNVAISDPASHASLARSFLAEHCADADLLNMVQNHDEPHAIWRQFTSKGSYNQRRFQTLLDGIRDWNLFLAFNIIDGCTAGKGRESLRWFFREVAGRVRSCFSEADIIES